MSYLKYDGSAAAQTNAPVSNLYGTAGAETLNGTGAAESLWGPGGDLMVGGAGDDTYYIQSLADRVVEQAGGGIDTVVGWRSLKLADFANVENLKIDGKGIYAAGNAADNVVSAGAGAEQLYGGRGQDVLVGGTGPDTFIVVKGEGNDVIYGFKPGSDVVRLSAGYTDFAQVKSHMTQSGADVRIDLGGGDGLILRNTQLAQLTGGNFQLQLAPTKLGAMTFHDEFSAPLSIWNATYNPKGTWRPDFGYQGANGAGSYTLPSNGEQQIYTSPYFRGHAGNFSESPFISNGDGTLSIIARPSSNSEIFGYHYTSGMISTKQSFAQTYGYFEMRADLPHAAGGWPAFWLVPSDGSWPPELDVMETLTADPNADHTTQHSNAGGVMSEAGLTSYIPDTADGFHTYGVLWTATDLTWYVDGVQVFHTATPADMNKPMYMIANLALGGWGGTVNNGQMPAEMKIDYIRAYSLAGTGGSGIPASPPPPVSPPPVSPPPTGSGVGMSLTSDGHGDNLVGGAGADTLTSYQGGETMTGGAGADIFAFHVKPWTPTHITDFQPGVDRLDLSGLYTNGYHGTNPVADGYVKFASDGAGGTKVLVDLDGPGTVHPWADYLINLDHVSPSQLTAANVFGSSGSASAPGAPTPAPPPPPPSGGVTLTSGYAGATLAGGAGNDTLNASKGADRLTGGAGNDHFVYRDVPWAPSHVTDFTHGQDVLDLRGVFAHSNYSGTNPVADHYLSFVSDGNGGTSVLFDRDGSGTGQLWPLNIIDLEHVSPSSLTSQDWIIR